MNKLISWIDAKNAYYWLMFAALIAAIGCIGLSGSFIAVFLLLGTAALFGALFHDEIALTIAGVMATALAIVFGFANLSGMAGWQPYKLMAVIAILGFFYALIGAAQGWHHSDALALRVQRLAMTLIVVALIAPATIFGYANAQTGVIISLVVLLVILVGCHRKVATKPATAHR